MEKLEEGDQIIELLSFSKKIAESEIKKFLEEKKILFNSISFIDFEDEFSKLF